MPGLQRQTAFITGSLQWSCTWSLRNFGLCIMDGMTVVPCNGCRRCCINDAIRILPTEDASKWKTEAHTRWPWERMLAHKSDGECYYLGEAGCTIQDDKPQQCYSMDCRNIAANVTYTNARKMGIITVWRRGKELIASAK